MSGLKLTIPTTFTNLNLPYLRDDAVLPRQGALMLIDPTHPANAWAAEVPADQSTIPNIASSQLLELTGAGKTTTSKLVKPAGFSGTSGLLERTTKGGLHGIVPQSGAHTQGSGSYIAFHTDMIAYILANPQHDYYASYWGRLTRGFANTYGSGTMVGINGNGQQTNSTLIHMSSNQVAGTRWNQRPAIGGANELLRTEEPDSSALGNKFLAKGTTGWVTATAGLTESLPGDGTNQSITGAFAGGGIYFGSPLSLSHTGIGATGSTGNGNFTHQATVGTVSSQPASQIKDSLASHILYRFYLEDLTVSGRTSAQVSAIDKAEYDKQVKTAGGRYYGDTFTDPATMP